MRTSWLVFGTGGDGSGDAVLGAATLPAMSEKPILAVDVDGVISLFGFDEPPDKTQASFQLIDGMVHCISLAAGKRLERLSVFITTWSGPPAGRTRQRLAGAAAWAAGAAPT